MVRSMVIVGADSVSSTRHRIDPPHPGLEVASEFADSIRVELGPEGLAETTTASRIIQALWIIRSGDPGVARAERSLLRNLRALSMLRALRPARDPGSIDSEPSDEAADLAWRSRLVFDVSVSETSPVVRGTWITVGQVISRIIDGWRWADLLRAYPELCEDDIRACLAFATEEESGR